MGFSFAQASTGIGYHCFGAILPSLIEDSPQTSATSVSMKLEWLGKIGIHKNGCCGTEFLQVIKGLLLTTSLPLLSVSFVLTMLEFRWERLGNVEVVRPWSHKSCVVAILNFQLVQCHFGKFHQSTSHIWRRKKKKISWLRSLKNTKRFWKGRTRNLRRWWGRK